MSSERASSERVASERLPTPQLPTHQLAPTGSRGSTATQNRRAAAAHDLRSTLAAIGLASANVKHAVSAPAGNLDPDRVTVWLAAIDAAVAEAGQLLGRLVD